MPSYDASLHPRRALVYKLLHLLERQESLLIGLSQISRINARSMPGMRAYRPALH